LYAQRFSRRRKDAYREHVRQRDEYAASHDVASSERQVSATSRLRSASTLLAEGFGRSGATRRHGQESGLETVCFRIRVDELTGRAVER
jgi:hypothetical protein